MLSQQFSVGVCRANDFLTNQIADRHCFALALEGLLFFKIFGKSGKIGAKRTQVSWEQCFVWRRMEVSSKNAKNARFTTSFLFGIYGTQILPHLPNFCQSNAK